MSASMLGGIALVALWLLLNGISVGQLLLGVTVTTIAIFGTRRLRDGATRLHAPLTAAKLLVVFGYDIVRANIDVAKRILGPEAAIRPGYFWYPIALKHPAAITTLAAMITMTPGTLSASLSKDRRQLLVHTFHLDDQAAVIEEIRARFETPLAEIFR
jgi:multicomponent K+:H+ antiporter subunit E